MIRLNLDLIGRMRGISNPRQFLIRHAKVSPMTADKLLKGTAVLIKFERLEYICRELNCTPNDILEWTPSKNDIPLTEGHPLKQLSQKYNPNELITQLGSITTEELYELIKRIDNKPENKDESK